MGLPFNSEARFFQLSADLLAIAGYGGYFLRLNPRWTDVLGFSLEELYSQPIIEFIHPDDREASLQECKRAALSQRVASYECRYLCKDGSFRWLQWSVTAYPEEQLFFAVARDITQQKWLAEALLSSWDQYQEIFDNSNDLVQSTDTEGRFLYVNPVWRRVLGYQAEELSSMTLWDVIDPEDHELCHSLFQQLGAKEPSEQISLSFRHKAGHIVYVEGSFSGRFREGVWVGCGGFFRDVTARRRAEEEERAATALLRTISAIQEEFIAGFDTRRLLQRLLSRLMQLTQSTHGVIGLVVSSQTEEYLSTKDGLKFYDPRDDEEGRAALRLLREVYQVTEPVVLEHQDQHFLGIPFCEGRRVLGVVGLSGRPGGYDERLRGYLAPFLLTISNLLETHRNERRRQSAEQILRESEARLRAIVENAADAILTLNEKGIIEALNPAAERLFDYRTEQLLGRNAGALWRWPSEAPPSEHLNTFSAGGVRRELVGFRRDQTFSLEISVSEVHNDDRRMFIVIARDLTERKKIERLKEEFIATVSHELRTPLTSIVGSLGLLAGGIAGELSDAAREMISIARRNSERLVHLINDILDVQRIEAGALRIRPRVLDLMRVVQQSIEVNESLAASAHLKLVLQEAPSSAFVYADEDRLLQVLANLISNAAKFSPQDNNIEVSVACNEEDVICSVRDFGPGVPPEFQQRLFQRFAQADASDSRPRGGTGLGLSICKELVERMGGRIWYEPALGGGACFLFSLPLWQGDAPEEE